MSKSNMFGYYDNPIMNTLRFITDIVLLNILFVVCSIPIVTIGASLTSLYAVTMQMVRKESPSVSNEFFQAFKKNFKQSTVLWLLTAVIGVIIGLDIYFIRNGLVNGFFEKLLIIVLGIAGLLLATGLVYLYPYIARFVNTTKEYLKNSFIIGVMNFPFTIMLISSIALLIAGFVNYTQIFTYSSFFVFALFAYFQSYVLVRVFKKYEK